MAAPGLLTPNKFREAGQGLQVRPIGEDADTGTRSHGLKATCGRKASVKRVTSLVCALQLVLAICLR